MTIALESQLWPSSLHRWVGETLVDVTPELVAQSRSLAAYAGAVAAVMAVACAGQTHQKRIQADWTLLVWQGASFRCLARLLRRSAQFQRSYDCIDCQWCWNCCVCCCCQVAASQRLGPKPCSPYRRLQQLPPLLFDLGH